MREELINRAPPKIRGASTARVKRIAVPIADVQKKVHREDHDTVVLDSFGSEELMRATIRLLMKNGVFTLEELLVSLKSE